MNPKVFFGLAILGCALSTTSALLGTFAAVGAGTGTALSFTALGSATTTTGFLTASGAAVLGGAVLLKAAALAVAASELSRGRGKRSADRMTEGDLAIAALAQTEPAQCYRRLICDLATGTMPKSENDVILSLFDAEVPAENPRFDFLAAKKVGKLARNTQVCELRYSCPLTGSQIQKIFRQL